VELCGNGGRLISVHGCYNSTQPSLQMSKQSIIEIFVLATILPFLLWAALAIVGRKNAQLLARIYPWVRALSWGTWALPLLIFPIVLFGGFQHRHVAFFCVAITFNGGIQSARSWVQRRINPDSIPRSSSGGWWPAKREF
jgi:hypothetical protein